MRIGESTRKGISRCTEGLVVWPPCQPDRFRNAFRPLMSSDLPGNRPGRCEGLAAHIVCSLRRFWSKLGPPGPKTALRAAISTDIGAIGMVRCKTKSESVIHGPGRPFVDELVGAGLRLGCSTGFGRSGAGAVLYFLLQRDLIPHPYLFSGLASRSDPPERYKIGSSPHHLGQTLPQAAASFGGAQIGTC